MKKVISIFGVTLISTLLLSACQTNDSASSKTNSATSSITQTSESDSNAVTSSNENDVNSSKEEVKNEEAQPVEYTYQVNPEIFTIPSMLKSPTLGKSLFNAIPGLRGLFSISTCPTLLTAPKQASMAIINGFLCFDFIIFTWH